LFSRRTYNFHSLPGSAPINSRRPGARATPGGQVHTINRDVQPGIDTVQLGQNDTTVRSLSRRPEKIGVLTGVFKTEGHAIQLGSTRRVRSQAPQRLVKIAEVMNPFPLNYARKWGVERIFLDGIQNHLPGDSGGTKLSISFLVDGQWRSFENMSGIDPSRVEGVRYADDGTGFDYGLLSETYSTKVNDGDDESAEEATPSGAAGENGEGLKLITLAALRLGFDVRIRSNDWQAVPRVIGKEIIVSGKSRTIKKSMNDIYRMPDKKGSSTTFLRNGTGREFNQLVEMTLKGAEQILLLRSNYQSLFKGAHGELVDLSGDIFIKNIHITSAKRENLLFGYNLTRISPNRDRNSTADIELHNAISDVLAELNAPSLIRDFILRAQAKGIDTIDTMALNTKCPNVNTRTYTTLRVPELWLQAFNLFGAKAVLGSNANLHDTRQIQEADRLAQALGFTVIQLPKELASYLVRCGVKSANQVNVSEDARLLGGETYDPQKILVTGRETSLTLAYRAAKWDLAAAARDLLANHMRRGRDSTELPLIEFQIKTDDFYEPMKWVPRGTDIKKATVLAIRISDKGSGYENDVLGTLFHAGDGTDVTGQFGEGMDKSAATVLRVAKDNGLDVQVKLASRGWVAMPFAVGTTINGKPATKLNYKIATGLSTRQGSATTLLGPPDELVELFDKRLGHLALPFNANFKPLHQTAAGQVFVGDLYSPTILNGTMYVHDFRVTEANKSRLLFSYNLYTRDISPDRDQIDPAVAQAAVADIIRSCLNPDVIKTIVRQASVEKNSERWEFIPISFSEANKAQGELYKKAFHEIYGAKAVLAGSSPFIQAEAIHKGYKPIEMHPNVRQTLINAGVMTDADVARENYTVDPIPYEKLSATERSVLDVFTKIDQILGLRGTGRPIIFDCVRLKDGTFKEEIAGFYKLDAGEPPYIQRAMLADLAAFAKVYIHEKGHEQTKKSDPEDGFRNFFEVFLTRFVMDQLAEGKGQPLSRPVASEDRTGFIDSALIEALEKEARVLKASLEEWQQAAHRAGDEVIRLQQSVYIAETRISTLEQSAEILAGARERAEAETRQEQQRRSAVEYELGEARAEIARQEEKLAALSRQQLAMRVVPLNFTDRIKEGLSRRWTLFFVAEYRAYLVRKEIEHDEYMETLNGNRYLSFERKQEIITEHLADNFPQPWFTKNPLWDLAKLPETVDEI